jgi:6-pyruvoyltetrahydropterin/6-carboxytetrahydropterin synthase
MFVSKKFKWEAAHRIPWHSGKCRNLHGHSYKMEVELEGDVNAKGIVIDFNDIKRIIDPYVELLDHSTIISGGDEELIEVFRSKNWKYFVMEKDSTAENMCSLFTNIIMEENSAFLKDIGIKSIGVRVYETETAFAYLSTQISSAKN